MAGEREPMGPLVGGFVLAVLVHILMLPWLAQWLVGQPMGITDQLFTQHLKPLLPEPRELKLGRDAPKVSSIAWIPYDDFRELIAPSGPTEQPALQQEVDPVPDAPMPIEPAPARAEAARQAQAVDEAIDTGQGRTQEVSPSRHPAEAHQAEQYHPISPLEVTDLILGGKVTEVRRKSPMGFEPSQGPVQEAQPEDAGGASGATEPSSRSAQSPTQPATESSNPTSSPQEGADPTSAPRSDRESAPVTLRNHADTVQPGGVLVGEGIEIKTVRPRFSVVTRVSVLPRNPMALVVFDHEDGRVIEAKLITSSGYPNVDGPVLASLYQWRATGLKLDELDRPFELKIRLVLMNE